jgi:hypothetical protein
MTNWYPVMTDAGRAAIQAADGLGLSARITHVALGEGRYAVRGADGGPTNVALSATALLSERLRVPVYAGGSPEPGSLLIVAQVPQAPTLADEFYISEVGFFDADGVLMVVWSDLATSMGHRGTLAPWNMQLAWSWRDMPSNAITVQVVNAAFSDQLLRTAQMRDKMQRLAQEAGVPFYDADPTTLNAAIDAKVNQAFVSLNKPIRQAIAVAPADGSVGQLLTPQLRGSSFFSADGYAHTSSQFIVTNQAGVVLHDSGEVAPAVEYTLPTGLLAILTTYRWRLRYKGVLGASTVWSDWSADAGFTTASTIVAPPSMLTPANGAVNIAAQPTLTSTAFAVLNGNDAHLHSRWQISTSPDFSGALTWDSGNVTSLTQIVVPAVTLAANTTYHVRVRHIGQVLGPSGWSAPTTFQTRTVFTYVAPPNVTSPTNGQVAVSLTPTIILSAFTVIGGADTHDRSQVQVRLATGGWGAPAYDSGELAAATSHTIPIAGALPISQSCIVRARFRGQVTGWSAWSNEVAFATVIPSGLAVYDTPGSHTWTCPAGVTSVTVEVVGSSGAGYVSSGSTQADIDRDGGNYWTGGGGGGYARKQITVVPGQQYTLVVGAGGRAPFNGGPGGNGQTSSFAGIVSATGGLGGVDVRISGNQAAGGVGIDGDHNANGAHGFPGGSGGSAGDGGGRGGWNGLMAVSANSRARAGLALPGENEASGGYGGVGIYGAGQKYGGGGNYTFMFPPPERAHGADGVIAISWGVAS